MKRICVLGICLLTTLSGWSQGPSEITPYGLTISMTKTTNLVFPYAIKSVDRGSRDVLAQKAKGVENVLQVKAGKENFNETNLSVITADGKLYSFLVGYAVQPSQLNVVFDKDRLPVSAKGLFADSINQCDLQATAAWVSQHRANFTRIRDNSYGIRLKMNALYIDRDIFYFRLTVHNNTAINYDVDQLQFLIKDKRQSKRTASQEIVQRALYIHGDVERVKAESTQTIVIGLPKFTIPDKKALILQVMEKRGGRHLLLRIGNRTIVGAQPIVHSLMTGHAD